MKLVHIYSIVFFTITLLFSGCMEDTESDFERQIREDDSALENYLAEHEIKAERLNSGIYIEPLRENPGGTAVENESIVAVRYRLRTLAGKAIDSLDSAASSLRFFHAQKYPNALYPRGINIGVGHMRTGEQYRLYLPSYQAFESYSFGQYLPRNAILVADIEVEEIITKKAIEEEEEQIITNYVEEHNLTDVQKLPSGVFFQLLEEGSGEQPTTGALAKVNFKGYYLDDAVFSESEKDNPYAFYVGKTKVIPGFEDGVEAMNKGAKARIFIPSHLGFAEGVQVIPPAIRKNFLEELNARNWRPYEPVIFELELVDF
ncbi:FKBP-type peptidyl-prolyl cis-trans isomerase [Tunicatimonas pelagia]|uniref:FKBP-type peptidyl-prolyl cis-trans isomerase n=1 Tax=Tunicatimonas pelagia TaxID=931531 RepID=UPI002665D657|nr:FKBP-type peptidyl-prolyl cis-trans isomerase [Tunicatimonas pelagia]WKN42452.1 FKBP-type peptidyl-prolyl cis-trans isomerase [Tunicatimonas pelagia]